MHHKSKNIKIAGFVILSFLLISCSNKYVDDIKRGAGYNYVPGFPELRMDVSEYISEKNETIIRVVGHVVENSLVFKKDGDSISAYIQVDIEFINHDTGKQSQLNFRAEITRETGLGYQEEEFYTFRQEIPTTPGNYEVITSVRDLATQKVVVRNAEVFLPNPVKTASNITNISLLTRKNAGSFEYATTYDIGNDVDTVRFQFQVTNNDSENPVVINSRLIKFKSDTSVALPMSYSNPSASNIIYKGINYNDFIVVQHLKREFRQPGNVMIEYNFTDLERGNYRFEVAENLENRERLFKARDFGVKSENYPALKTPRELARPLVYLMQEDDYRRLMEIETDDSLKQALDRFWLRNIQNSALARNVISLYYQRVEEANKMFSNYKEGWKTDLGMIYILFGPPLDDHVRLREIRWSYRFNTEDSDYTYYFRNIKTKTRSYPFHNYMLRRANHYFNIEYRQRSLWLSGDIIRN